MFQNPHICIICTNLEILSSWIVRLSIFSLSLSACFCKFSIWFLSFWTFCSRFNRNERSAFNSRRKLLKHYFLKNVNFCHFHVYLYDQFIRIRITTRQKWRMCGFTVIYRLGIVRLILGMFLWNFPSEFLVNFPKKSKNYIQSKRNTIDCSWFAGAVWWRQSPPQKDSWIHNFRCWFHRKSRRFPEPGPTGHLWNQLNRWGVVFDDFALEKIINLNRWKKLDNITTKKSNPRNRDTAFPTWAHFSSYRFCTYPRQRRTNNRRFVDWNYTMFQTWHLTKVKKQKL